MYGYLSNIFQKYLNSQSLKKTKSTNPILKRIKFKNKSLHLENALQT